MALNPLKWIENLVNWIVAPVQDPINKYLREKRKNDTHIYIIKKDSESGKNNNRLKD